MRSIMESVREYIMTFPALKDGCLLVDYLGAEPIEYTVEGVPGSSGKSPGVPSLTMEGIPTDPIYQKYIDGDCIRQFLFLFASRECYSADVNQCIENLAFYGVPSEDGETTFHRMRKFTQFNQSKNPIEYSRQYVDEPFQRTDLVGYAPSIAYAFDKHSALPVHLDMIDITDRELVGADAVRSLLLVDTETGKAIQRDYAVVPGTEGDNINIYTYSGTFKCCGDKQIGTAASSDNWMTATFTAEEDAS